MRKTIKKPKNSKLVAFENRKVNQSQFIITTYLTFESFAMKEEPYKNYCWKNPFGKPINTVKVVGLVGCCSLLELVYCWLALELGQWGENKTKLRTTKENFY